MNTRAGQIPLNFEPGLTTKYRRLEDCCAAAVMNYSQGLEGVAAPLDMSPSELSRRLNAHLEAKEGSTNNRPLRVEDFVGILDETNDFRPIFWLIERFLRDPEAQRTQAINQLAQVLPMIQTLIEQAGGKASKR